MNYVKTTMTQAGYNLENAKIIVTNDTSFVEIQRLKAAGFNIPEDFLSVFNLKLTDNVPINFNIEIKTSPIKKK